MISIAGLGITSLLFLFFYILIGSLGLPGGTVTMIGFGSLAGSFSGLVIVILISFIAAVFGDILAYELARRLSEQFRSKLRRLSFFVNNELKAKNLLDKYGFIIIFFTRFALISLCVVVSYISGFEKISRKKFILAVITGEFLFAIIYPLIGFVAGEIFSSMLTTINDIIIVILLVVLVFYFIRFLIKRRRKS